MESLNSLKRLAVLLVYITVSLLIGYTVLANFTNFDKSQKQPENNLKIQPGNPKTTTTTTHNTNVPSSLSRQKRVIHGDKISPQYDHSVVLIRVFFVDDDNSAKIATCTGTLITQNFVLTVAHCFTRYLPTGAPPISDSNATFVTPDRRAVFKNMDLPSQFWFGLHSYEEYVGLAKGKKDWKNYEHVQMVKVKGHNNYHFHPNWAMGEQDRIDNKGQWSDVVLVKMPIKITKQTPQAIFAPAQIDWYPNNVKMVVIGFGVTNVESMQYNSKITPQKEFRGANVQTKTKQWCIKKGRSLSYSSQKMNLSDVMCGVGIRSYTRNRKASHGPVKTKAKQQICVGDSGGPVYVQYQCENSATWCWAQLGMVIWVDKYCKKNFNGFLRLNDYVSWMETVVEREIASRSWYSGRSEVNDRIKKIGFEGFYKKGNFTLEAGANSEEIMQQFSTGY